MITINMEKAREIHRNKIREARIAKFAELDVAFQRALESGADTSQIVAQKQLLRDAPNDPAIDAASTIEELKNAWPNYVGVSPYTGA